MRDELRYVHRHDLMQNTAKDTLTIRNNPTQEALPMRRLGSFLPGEVVGGSGVHWSGHTWRWTDMEFKIRSFYEERYGKSFIPADMTIQDWGITYAELEPYYDKFEYAAAVSGKAGNIRGQIQPGGNPFEAPRARDYPLPAAHVDPGERNVQRGGGRTTVITRSRAPAPTRRARIPIPTARASARASIAAFASASAARRTRKGSPHITVIPIAMRNPNFELRTHAWVTKVLKDSSGKRVTGVTYTNVLNGEEFEQPAAMVLLTRLRDQQRAPDAALGHRPAVRPGQPERRHRQELLLPDRRRRDALLRRPELQSLHGGGRIEHDHRRLQLELGFRSRQARLPRRVHRRAGFNTALPIGYRPVPRGTPAWGKAWKAATAKWYQTAMVIGASGSVMANRYNYYDLDPTYRNAFGQPLMRMTFDYKANEHKMGQHAAQVINDIAKSMNPTSFNPATARTEPWTVVPYQSTHNTGGTIMGTNPRASALNKYLQSWDCHNLFVVGANVFAHNASYNPTGPVGALAYWTADAIKNRYMKNPGPLVSA